MQMAISSLLASVFFCAAARRAFCAVFSAPLRGRRAALDHADVIEGGSRKGEGRQGKVCPPPRERKRDGNCEKEKKSSSLFSLQRSLSKLSQAAAAFMPCPLGSVLFVRRSRPLIFFPAAAALQFCHAHLALCSSMLRESLIFFLLVLPCPPWLCALRSTLAAL